MSGFLLFIEKRYNWIFGFLAVCMITSIVLFCLSLIQFIVVAIFFFSFAILLKMVDYYVNKAFILHIEELKKTLRYSFLKYLHKHGYEYFYADENADAIEKEIAAMVQAESNLNNLEKVTIDIFRKIPSQSYNNKHISIDIIDQKVEYKITAQFRLEKIHFSFTISSDKTSIETN